MLKRSDSERKAPPRMLCGGWRVHTARTASADCANPHNDSKHSGGDAQSCGVHVKLKFGGDI